MTDRDASADPAGWKAEAPSGQLALPLTLSPGTNVASLVALLLTLGINTRAPRYGPTST